MSPAAASRKTYVLDTSVLLAAGARALRAFAEHEVVLPLVVITELEGKRNDPEIGWIARQVLRALEEYRVQAADKGLSLRDEPGVTVNDDGGTVRIELNHVDQTALPDAIRREKTHDVRILAVAHGLQNEADAPRSVVLVSRDLPMRLLAGGVLGLAAEDYRNDQAPDSGYSGVEYATVTKESMDTLYGGQPIVLDDLADAPVNTGVVIDSYSGGGAVGVVTDATAEGARVHLIRSDISAFGMKPHSAEQRIALHHLLDPEVGIVSLGGRAGTGKSVLAIAAGLEAVLERREQDKIVVFRPLYAVGGQDLGYLPGSEAEKMAPWAQAVFDALGSIASKDVLDEVTHRQLIEVLPLTHIRGRTLHRTWAVVDEAQSLERPILMAALSRLGTESKVVLTHDVAQRDNLRVGRHDGVATVVERLKGNKLFAHVTLTRSERSAVAELVTRLLDSGE